MPQEQASAKVIADLQSACELLAHLTGQYQVDVRQLKAMGLKWLAHCVKKWYGETEDQLRIFIDRLLYFDTDPEYDAGTVAGTDGVDALLARDEDLVYTALEQFIKFRGNAWNAQMDYTPDLYEHAIKELEEQGYKIRRERRLIAKLGEPGYVGARLEDS